MSVVTKDGAPARVLVIEEEPLYRMEFVRMLHDFGCEVAAEGSTLREAITLAKTAIFDVAILDVRLNRLYVFPAADILIERNLPFIFATGLMPHDTPERHRHRPVLKKPFSEVELHQLLARVLTDPRPHVSP